MASRPTREPGRSRSDAEHAWPLAETGGRRPDGAQLDRLLDAAAHGDTEARESLTNAHLEWVMAAARERADHGLGQADLFQEGTIGLILAIESFHSSARADFEAFAREQIANSMDGALGSEAKAVRDGQMLVQAAEDYECAEISVRRELGRAATDAELAQKLEWSVERTIEIGHLVTEARRRHDEELLEYLELDDVDVRGVVEGRAEGNGR